jgi:hypothetical protein
MLFSQMGKGSCSSKLLLLVMMSYNRLMHVSGRCVPQLFLLLDFCVFMGVVSPQDGCYTYTKYTNSNMYASGMDISK